MKILILAAGYATRLYPLTIDTPKPLLPVCGKAIIDKILDKIASLDGAKEIYVVTNDRFADKFEEWAKISQYSKRLSVINDGTSSNETRLGAIKDLELVITKKKIKDDLLVVAGDNLFCFDMVKFITFARSKKGAISVALHDIKDIGAAKRFGVVKIDERCKIVDFEEKPEKPKSTLIATGIYFFPKEKLPALNEYISTQTKRSDAPGNYISWMSKREDVFGLPFDEEWYDIGDLESYKRAEEECLKKGDR